jgi:hypothetical protein
LHTVWNIGVKIKKNMARRRMGKWVVDKNEVKVMAQV